MGKKIYRLRDLLLSKEDITLLNAISEELNIRNTDLARILLTKALKEIRNQDLSNYSIGLVGVKK